MPANTDTQTVAREPELARTGMVLPAALYREMRILALRRGITVQDLFAEAARQYLTTASNS